MYAAMMYARMMSRRRYARRYAVAQKPVDQMQMSIALSSVKSIGDRTKDDLPGPSVRELVGSTSSGSVEAKPDGSPATPQHLRILPAATVRA